MGNVSLKALARFGVVQIESAIPRAAEQQSLAQFHGAAGSLHGHVKVG